MPGMTVEDMNILATALKPAMREAAFEAMTDAMKEHVRTCQNPTNEKVKKIEESISGIWIKIGIIAGVASVIGAVVGKSP